jgi:hypothetical protein
MQYSFCTIDLLCQERVCISIQDRFKAMAGPEHSMILAPPSLYFSLKKKPYNPIPVQVVFLSVQTGCGAHPASCPMGTGGKARPGRDADHSPPSSVEVKNEYELYLFSVHALPQHVAGQRYFYFYKLYLY